VDGANRDYGRAGIEQARLSRSASDSAPVSAAKGTNVGCRCRLAPDGASTMVARLLDLTGREFAELPVPHSGERHCARVLLRPFERGFPALTH
jgi:hypothetical protein